MSLLKEYVIANELKKFVSYKYGGILLLRTLLRILDIFPVRKRRILFYSFNGKQYSDSPRCVTEVLLAEDPGKYELIWAFKRPEKFRGELPRGVRAVRYRSPRYYYLAKTARVLVFNVQGFGELARRRQQIFIQTWHASNGYKKIGDVTGIRRKNILLWHRDYSCVCSGAGSMTQRRIRGSMGFHGRVIRGTPRMDAIVRGELEPFRRKVFKKYGLPEDAKLVLCAPTWVPDRRARIEVPDFNRLFPALEARFGGKWYAAVRLHPNMKTIPKYSDPRIIEATGYPDMLELLGATDVLISDYSSCVWDYSFTFRPCFLYCAGADERKLREDFDLPVRSWGFPVAVDMDELEAQIRIFDEAAFRKCVERHHRDMDSHEDGRATERVVSLIRQATR